MIIGHSFAALAELPFRFVCEKLTPANYKALICNAGAKIVHVGVEHTIDQTAITLSKWYYKEKIGDHNEHDHHNESWVPIISGMVTGAAAEIAFEKVTKIENIWANVGIGFAGNLAGSCIGEFIESSYNNIAGEIEHPHDEL